MPRTKEERHEECKGIFNEYNVIKPQLMDKYKAEEEFINHSFGNVARIISHFLDASGIKEADQYNRELLRFVNTKEGQAKFTKAICSKIMNLDFTKLYSQDIDEVVDFVKDNYALLATAWDPSFIDSLQADGKYITDEDLSVYQQMTVAFQAGAGPLCMVISYASPEILNDEYDSFGVLKMTEKIMTTHPEAMMKQLDETKIDPIQYFIAMSQYNEDKVTESNGLKKLKEKNIEIKKFADFGKYNFFSNNGEPIKSGNALKALGKGEEVTIEQKSAEEIAKVEELSKPPLPQWTDFIAFLNSQFNMGNTALSNKSQALQFIVVDPEEGKSKPLAIEALVNGVEEPEKKDSFDKLMWAISNSKPLSSFNQEEQKKFMELVSENKIAVFSPYMSGRNSTMITTENGMIKKGQTKQTNKLLDAAYRFLENHICSKRENAFTESGLAKMQNDFSADKIQRDADSMVRKYGLPSAYRHLFIEGGIDPATVEDFDFMKGNDFEEKKKALNEYFQQLFIDPKTQLTKEELNAIEEENLEIGDIRVLAYNQKISVKEYIDNKIIKYATEPAKTQIDDALEEINYQLRAKAVNPLEEEMAESMIRMKELSFTAGNRTEMDKLFARLIALETVADKYDIKRGQVIINAPEKTENIRKALASLDKHTEDVYTSEPFRYILKKISNAEMSNLPRGNNFDIVDRCYEEIHNFIMNKSMDDPMVQLDKICTYTTYLESNEMFVPDKLNLNGKFKDKPANPFNLTEGRTTFNTYAVGKMLERGYDLEDILDPYKLVEVKKDVGEMAFEQFQINTPENREKVANTLMLALEKSVEGANKQMKKLKSLCPADIVKLNDPSFFAVGNLLKDAYQELGKLNTNPGFTGAFKDKFERMTNEADAVNKYYAYSEYVCENVLSYNQGKEAFRGNSTVVMSDFVTGEYFNKMFLQVKKNAAANNRTFGQELVHQYSNAAENPNTFIARAQNAAPLAVEYVKEDVSDNALSAINSNAENKKKLAKDVFTGEFSRKIKLKVKEITNDDDPAFTADSEKYVNQFKKKQPALEL